MHDCRICPRNCGADRKNGKTGYCGQTSDIRIARAALHMWEEPCISGTNGSGTVFFSGCNLRCVFCQNKYIALGETGAIISSERLTEIFFELKEKGANNINLVTPTHYVPEIVKTLRRAEAQGLGLPVVYNTSGYESVETLKQLDGLVQIYLPDFKYYDSAISRRYSHAEDYFEVASAALREMVHQTGTAAFSEKEDQMLMTRGTIVRHLVLPGCTEDSKKVIQYLYETYGDTIFISIMNQFTPCTDLTEFPEINRKVTAEEYDEVVDYAIEIGVENGFIQEGETAEESFIPSFDLEGVYREEDN